MIFRLADVPMAKDQISVFRYVSSADGVPGCGLPDRPAGLDELQEWRKRRSRWLRLLPSAS
jgi:hypothetical protein